MPGSAIIMMIFLRLDVSAILMTRTGQKKPFNISNTSNSTPSSLLSWELGTHPQDVDRAVGVSGGVRRERVDSTKAWRACTL